MAPGWFAVLGKERLSKPWGGVAVYSNKEFCCCSEPSLLQDQEGQLQPSPAARGWQAWAPPRTELQRLAPPKRVCARDLGWRCVCQGRVCSWGHSWVKLAAPLSVFPVPAAVRPSWPELRLGLSVYQVQDLKAGWFYLEHECFKAWLKSERGSTSRDAQGRTSCAT